jgi:hypothetical protein
VKGWIFCAVLSSADVRVKYGARLVTYHVLESVGGISSTGIVVRAPGYISRGPWFDFRRYQVF